IGGDDDGHFERRRRVVAWGQLLRLLVLHADAEAPGELFEGRGLRVAAAHRAMRYAELFRNSRSARRDGAWRRGRGSAAAASPARLTRRPPGGAQDEGGPLRRSAPPPPSPPLPAAPAPLVLNPAYLSATARRTRRRTPRAP